MYLFALKYAYVIYEWSLSQDIVNSQKPLAIYAQVIKGPSPVLNADVTVTITVTKPDGNGNTFNLRLVDDGSGGMYYCGKGCGIS